MKNIRTLVNLGKTKWHKNKKKYFFVRFLINNLLEKKKTEN